MVGISKKIFIREFSKKVMEGNAAFFVGAGLSRAAGYIDWKDLLREIAEELGLTVDREYDLIAVAQYHQNEHRSRSILNQKLIEEFTKDAEPTTNHTLIAQLPIHIVWTTNYDTLLEEAFKAQHKHIDTKITQENIAQSRPGIDVEIYKMHGDISQPDQAVLTKDDYENYYKKRELFTIRLKSDLITKSFLFLGFSFSDPNIDYVLSRIRTLLGKNTPPHYCILKRPQCPNHPLAAEKADYEYDLRKLALRVDDLKRFGIQTILIDKYNEITELLSQLNSRVFSNNIFVSGSASQGCASFDFTRLLRFSRKLGHEIIKRKYNLVSGFGLGVGPELLVGSFTGAYLHSSSLRERLILRPFPLSIEENQKKEVYHAWRKDMISMTGFSIFLSGNKIDPNNSNRITTSDGVIEEFQIGSTQPFKSFPIPVGATGFAAQQIWREVMGNLERFFGSVDVAPEMTIIGQSQHTDEELLEAIFEIIGKVRTTTI